MYTRDLDINANFSIGVYERVLQINHLRWQLIADHNEWPNRIQ